MKDSDESPRYVRVGPRCTRAPTPEETTAAATMGYTVGVLEKVIDEARVALSKIRKSCPHTVRYRAEGTREFCEACEEMVLDL